MSKLDEWMELGCPRRIIVFASGSGPYKLAKGQPVTLTCVGTKYTDVLAYPGTRYAALEDSEWLWGPNEIRRLQRIIGIKGQ